MKPQRYQLSKDSVGGGDQAFDAAEHLLLPIKEFGSGVGLRRSPSVARFLLIHLLEKIGERVADGSEERELGEVGEHVVGGSPTESRWNGLASTIGGEARVVNNDGLIGGRGIAGPPHTVYVHTTATCSSTYERSESV